MDLKQEIIKRLSNRKYEKIFYFFENLDDLNFSKILGHIQEEGLIEVCMHENNKITIRIGNRFFYPVCEEMIKEFSRELVETMGDFLKEVNLSNRMLSSVHQDIEYSYELTNPNKFYVIDNNMRIITDGKQTPFEDNLYLVENAGFAIIETLEEDKITKLDVHYRFEDELYIGNILRQIMNEEYKKQQKKHYETEFGTQNDETTISYRK